VRGVSSHYTGLATLSYPTGERTCWEAIALTRWASTRSSGATKSAGRGHLFCGEHTSYDYQGFMEGGAISGVRRARKAGGAGVRTARIACWPNLLRAKRLRPKSLLVTNLTSTGDPTHWPL